MPRHIFLYLDEEDFQLLKQLKGSRTWFDFLVKPHLERKEVEKPKKRKWKIDEMPHLW